MRLAIVHNGLVLVVTLALALGLWSMVGSTMARVDRQLTEITQSVGSNQVLDQNPVGFVGSTGDYGDGSE